MEKMVKCTNCSKEVREDNVDRDGECSFCRAESRSREMTVGDLGSK